VTHLFIVEIVTFEFILIIFIEARRIEKIILQTLYKHFFFIFFIVNKALKH